MSFIGNIGPFIEGEEEFEAYASRLEQFFKANKVEDDLKAASFLAVMGARCFGLVKDLVSPKKPGACSFKELIDILKKHYCPKTIVIYERFKFYNCCQKEHESVQEFIAQIKSHASTCSFGDKLSEMLRDRLVMGLRNSKTQKALLTKEDLTFEEAVSIAVANEAADKDVEAIGASSSTTSTTKASTHSIAQKKKPTYGNKGNIPKSTSNHATPPVSSCYGCGGTHWKKNCPFKEAICHKCQKKGHIQKVCRKDKNTSSKSTSFNRAQSNANTNYYAETTSSATGSDAMNEYAGIYMNTTDSGKKPYLVKLILNGISVEMELDTGAARTLMPISKFYSVFSNPSKVVNTNVTLTKYGNVSMSLSGETTVSVSMNGDKSSSKSLTLLLVKEDGPSLLGRDWIEALKFPVGDIVPHTSSLNSITAKGAEEELKKLLDSFPALFQPGLGTYNGAKVAIEVDKSVAPKFCKPRLVPYALRERVDKELDRLLAEGIIEPVKYSKWACPIVPVVKPNGDIRICGDYKLTANKAINMDVYPLPKSEELFSNFSGGKLFSKLDLSQAYAQLQLEEESKPYTTINTHRGLFQYNRLCFGVSSAPAIFQRTVESLLQGVAPAYIDDIPVMGTSLEDHLKRLKTVLTILQDAGLRLNRDKCKWLLKEIEYLGFRISAEGIQPTEKKLQAISQAPEPKSVSELQAYLGLLNFYRKFLPNASTVLQPLTDLLKKDVRWSWGDEQKNAFEHSKKLLLNSKALAHFDPNLPIVVTADSSSYGVGAVLAHIIDGVERPVAFVSRTLNTAERNYAQIEREALGLVYALKKFHYYIYGKKFTLVTDHKPLVGIFSMDKAIPTMASGRIQRWCLLLQSYQFDLVHKSGKHIGNADALSRLPLPTTIESVPVPAEWVHLVQFLESTPVTKKDIAAWTEADPLLSTVKTKCISDGLTTLRSAEYTPYYRIRDELTVIEDCLLWGKRVVIPPAGRQKILQELHAEHVGASRMKELARSYLWWPGLDADLEKTVQECSVCFQLRKAPPKSELHPWEWPKTPWHRVHIDYAGPINDIYYLVIIDAHSKWMEVFPTKTITTSRTIQFLRNCFSRFGLPVVLVSDNGTQFTSGEFKNYISSMGIRHITTPVNHPATNGLAENAVGTFKSALGKISGEDVYAKVDKFLVKYKTTPHTTTGVAPANLMFGRSIRTIFDLLRPGEIPQPDPRLSAQSVKNRVAVKQTNQRKYHKGQKRCFGVNDTVLIRNYAKGPKWLPAKVKGKTSPVTYDCELETGNVVKKHIDQVWRMNKKDSTPKKEDPLQLPRPHPLPVSSPPLNTSPPLAVRRERRDIRPPSRLNL